MKTITFERIFHPSDFSKGDQHAFAHALKLAVAGRAELVLMHVDEPSVHTHWAEFPGVREKLRQWGVTGADAGSAEAGTGGRFRASKIQAHGHDPARQINHFLAEHSIDLIVLATHQRQGFARWLHHSVAEPIARSTAGMTLFVPRRVTGFVNEESGETRLHQILIPVDHEPVPLRALEAAVGVAETLGCRDVHFSILHIGKEESMPQASLPMRHNWTMEKGCWEGNTVERILEVAEARDVDLIVMATHGHHGFLDALRGSTTERVVRGAKCPVLAVPAV